MKVIQRYLGRIKAEEGTAEFDRQYWEIISGKKYEAKTSWSALIEAIRKTDKWKDYAPRYRQDLELAFDYLDGKIGSEEVTRLTKADIYDAMEKKPASRPVCELYPDCN